VALNYGSDGARKAKAPRFFTIDPASLVAHGSEVSLKAGSKDIRIEPELVVVMGAKASKVPEKDALTYVFGVAAGLDVTGTDMREGEFGLERRKPDTGKAVFGPWIVPGLSVAPAQVRGRRPAARECEGIDEGHAAFCRQHHLQPFAAGGFATR
jgi:2-keto-4-pentenoate hydratase/2-oxohepta-3-ene-1,7-dioic acid hydratase in catechol pathway